MLRASRASSGPTWCSRRSTRCRTSRRFGRGPRRSLHEPACTRRVVVRGAAAGCRGRAGWPSRFISRPTAGARRSRSRARRATIYVRLVCAARSGSRRWRADADASPNLAPKRREGALVAIGRLTPSKRYDHAIAAFAELRSTHPRATLTLIGGAGGSRLRALAAQLGVGDAVRFAGHVSEAEKIRILDECGPPDRHVGSGGLGPDRDRGGGSRHRVGCLRHSRFSRRRRARAHRAPRRPVALESRHGFARLLDDEELFTRVRTSAWMSVQKLSFDEIADAFEDALTGALACSSVGRQPRFG